MSPNEALLIGFVIGVVAVLFLWMTVEVMK